MIIISIRHLGQSELILMGVRQNKNFGIKVIPVSYTHLDVYKRQTMYLKSNIKNY